MIGACVYLAGLALSLPWNLPLIGLALFGTLAIVTSSRASAPNWSPLALAVVAFLFATALSTLVSEDVGRSLRLSAPFLPGVLLFLIVAEHFTSVRDVRFLYLTLSMVGLGLASVLLWFAWRLGETITNAARPNVGYLGIPILVVRNDVTFLALVAPLSLVLFLNEPRRLVRILTALSILFSLGVVCILRSRTAVLTMIITLTCTSVLLQRKRHLISGLAYTLVMVVFVFFIDGALGFPLAARFGQMKTVQWRITQSLAAWEMFLQAPVLGHGPHIYGLSHRAPWVHNLYAEVLAEQGCVGLLALGSLMVCGLVVAWQVQRTATAEARLLGSGALAGLIGFWSAGMVELSLLREWVVTTLFMLLGIIKFLSTFQPK